MAIQQWLKAQKLFNHQIKIIISRVTKVQGRNILVTARKSINHHNEIILGGHHTFPLPLLSKTHAWDRWSLFLLSTIKPEGGSKCSYADILSTNTHSLLGSNPHPLSAGYNNQKELSSPSTHPLGWSPLYDLRQIDFLILDTKGDFRAQA